MLHPYDPKVQLTLREGYTRLLMRSYFGNTSPHYLELELAGVGLEFS